MWTQEDYNTYLDQLRRDGITNMFGATPYLQAEFGISRKEAGAALSEWKATFSDRLAKGETGD